jgi:drug/metabolite transporter (DMT)-like permease
MNIFLYLICVLSAGTTWIFVPWQLGAIPLEVSIAYRFLLASLILFIGGLFTGHKAKKISLKLELSCVLQGILLFFLNYIFLYWAAHYIISGLVAVGVSSIVFMNIFFSYFISKTRINLKVLVASIVGISSVVFLFSDDLVAVDNNYKTFVGLGFVILGNVFSSLGAILSAEQQKHNLSPLEITTKAMFYGGVMNILFVLIKTPLTGWIVIFDSSFSYLFSLLYLSIASAFGFSAYITLIGRIGADKSAYAWVASPVIALILSTYFEDFSWTFKTYLGVFLIIAGNLFVLKNKSVALPPKTKTPSEKQILTKAA